MNTKISFKSALCGLAVGVLAMLATGASDSSSNPVGRYQIAGSLNYMMVVDTKTGRVWTANLPSNSSRGTDADFFEVKMEKGN